MQIAADRCAQGAPAVGTESSRSADRVRSRGNVSHSTIEEGPAVFTDVAPVVAETPRDRADSVVEESPSSIQSLVGETGGELRPADWPSLGEPSYGGPSGLDPRES